MFVRRPGAGALPSAPARFVDARYGGRLDPASPSAGVPPDCVWRKEEETARRPPHSGRGRGDGYKRVVRRIVRDDGRGEETGTPGREEIEAGSEIEKLARASVGVCCADVMGTGGAPADTRRPSTLCSSSSVRGGAGVDRGLVTALESVEGCPQAVCGRRRDGRNC